MIIQQQIETKLQQSLHPSYLLVENESYKHNVPPGSERHFKVTIVSELFIDQNLVKRHQLVYAQLKEELAGPIHALNLHTFTPEEWQSRAGKTTNSPACQKKKLSS